MKQSDPDPEAELGKSHNISAAPLHPRRAAPRQDSATLMLARAQAAAAGTREEDGRLQDY